MADTFMHPARTSEERKASPIKSGCLDYIPAALELFARLSKVGNDKHNPGQPLHHSRGKSNDHEDCEVRHMLEAGTIDPETGFDHAVAEFWRSGIKLQILAETKYGWPKAPAARDPEPVKQDVPPEAFWPSIPNGG